MSMPGKSKVVAFQFATIATNATSMTYVDRIGFDFVTIDVIHNVASATNASAKWTALKLQHSNDATNVSGITGASGTTNATAAAGEFVLPVHNDTAVPAVIRFHVDARDYGRYLHIEKQAAASYHSTANVANLFRAKEMPNTTTEAGVTAHVFV